MTISALVLHNWLEHENIPIGGCSYGPNKVNYAPEATAPQRVAGDALAAGFDTLNIETTKTTIIADGADETVISCFALGDNFDFIIYRNGVEYLANSVSDGSIEFSTNTPATYLFCIREQGGYATGYVEVIAS